MNFSLRLCAIVMLIFGGTLQVKPVGITTEKIKSLANKIEQGTKLNINDISLLNKLNQQHPNILAPNILTKLRFRGKLRISKINSSQIPLNNRRANVADIILNILAKNNLVSLTSQLAQDLKKADYAGLHDLVQNYLKEINTLEIESNTSEDIDSSLKTALKYGIADVVEYLIQNGAKITQDHIDYLSQAQAECEEDSNFDCAWFQSGADFEKCRELLETLS